MDYKVFLPSLGDDDDAVSGGDVSAWLAEVDTFLQEGDDLLELTTDKAAFVVPCPVEGILKERCVKENNEIAVGDLLAILEVTE